VAIRTALLVCGRSRFPASSTGGAHGLLLTLAAQPPEHHAHPHGGGEQDELLAESVKAPVVEVDGGDHARGVRLGDRAGKDLRAVGPRVVAEAWQAGERPQVAGDEAGGGDREEP
jgi:hypothetical protein